MRVEFPKNQKGIPELKKALRELNIPYRETRTKIILLGGEEQLIEYLARLREYFEKRG